MTFKGRLIPIQFYIFVTYSKEQDDHSIVLVTELVDNDSFAKLVDDRTVHIVF